MDNAKFEKSVKRIMINDDPNNVLEFDPTDAAFAERFYTVTREISAKDAEYNRRATALSANKKVDKYGLPENFSESLALLREMCEFMREKIDQLFGAGTSQRIFGDTLSLLALSEFFEAITPFITNARGEKINQYMHKGRSKRTIK